MISPELRRRIWRVTRISVGSILIVLGIAGLVLPFLQGIALILAGLAVLATELPWARRWLQAIRDRLRWFRRKGPVDPERPPPAPDRKDAIGHAEMQAGSRQEKAPRGGRPERSCAGATPIV